MKALVIAAIPHQQWLACARKTPYGTRRQAVEVATTVGKRCHQSLRVYKCPHCALFHLTKKR